MDSKQKPDNLHINTFLGYGTMLKGDLITDGQVRIDGDIDGKIEARGTVIIGKKGRANASISAPVVIVGGGVRGKIFASEKVEILGSGIVIGDIQSPRLEVQDGVILQGNCSIAGRDISRKELEMKKVGKFSLKFKADNKNEDPTVLQSG